MAKKNLLKDFDFKQFALEKGEHVVLWVAVAVTVLFIVLGTMMTVGSGSPEANAKPLADGTTKVRGFLNSSRPPDGTSIVPAELKKGLDIHYAPEGKGTCPQEFFVFTPAESSKRSNPEVLDPNKDFVVALARVQVPVMFVRAGKKKVEVAVLADENGRVQGGDAGTNSGAKGMLDQFYNRGGGEGRGKSGAGTPSAPGIPGQPGGSGGPPRFGGGRGANSGAGLNLGEEAKKEYKLDWIESDKLDDNVRLAEEMRPMRMAYVVGSFPYRKQMERIREALRYPTLADLVADKEVNIAFAGLNVERQTYTLDGQLKQDWQPLPLEDMMEAVLSQAIGIQEDKDTLDAVQLRDGLAMPRPKLRKGQDYPQSGKDDPVESDVAGIKKALADWEKKNEAQKSSYNATKNRFNSKHNLWNAKGGLKEEKEDTSEKKDQSPNKDVSVPENILVRFLDPSIEPGYIYKYRIQVKLTNPNYGKEDKVAFKDLAKVKELAAVTPDNKPRWTEIPQPVAVPNDLYFYAVDEYANSGDMRFALSREETPVQVHRWLEGAGQTPDARRDSMYPIGEWIVAKRIAVPRGEMVGHWIEVKIPVWATRRDSFVFLQPQRGHRGIKVDFRTGAVMVDFEGGKVTANVPFGGKYHYVADEAPIEQLVLSPEGKVLVRNGLWDKSDGERIKRVQEWEHRLDEVANKEDKAKKGADLKLDDSNKSKKRGN